MDFNGGRSQGRLGRPLDHKTSLTPNEGERERRENGRLPHRLRKFIQATRGGGGGAVG